MTTFSLLRGYENLTWVLMFGFALCCDLSDATSPDPWDVPPSSLKGHLQAFGLSGSNKDIEAGTEFPQPYDFLVNYVQKLKPLKMAGVALDSRAVHQWTDDYLLALDVPRESVVGLETMKKEDRSQETTEMHFHDFLKIYNQTEYYMVDDVPSYLKPDLTVPCSLQCPEMVEEGLAFAMMWFSSGGTKSVVHTDSFDNINCLIRGQKTFVLVDPARDRDKIHLKTEGAYSDIDVDSVDLYLHPKLADAEFYHVNLTAGDCLYIPYKWIHQVRSFNSNIAVNYWWNHHSSMRLLKQEGSVCQSQCDHKMALDALEIHHRDSTFEDFDNMRDWFKELALDKLTAEVVTGLLKMEYGVEDTAEDDDKLIRKFVEQMLEKVDLDKDGIFTLEEAEQTPVQIWTGIQKDMDTLTALLEEEKFVQHQEYAAYVAEDRLKEEL